MNKDLTDQDSPAQGGTDGFGVAASPLNKVKFELGIIICMGALLWLAVDSITAHVGAQLLILLVYGLSAMVWLIVRTRKIVQAVIRADASPHSGEDARGSE